MGGTDAWLCVCLTGDIPKGKRVEEEKKEEEGFEDDEREEEEEEADDVEDGVTE